MPATAKSHVTPSVAAIPAPTRAYVGARSSRDTRADRDQTSRRDGASHRKQGCIVGGGMPAIVASRVPPAVAAIPGPTRADVGASSSRDTLARRAPASRRHGASHRKQGCIVGGGMPATATSHVTPSVSAIPAPTRAYVRASSSRDTQDRRAPASRRHGASRR